MFINLEKFVKILSSSHSYWTLGIHKEEVIVGCVLDFLERRVRSGGPFQGPYESNVERKLPVYFIVNFSSRIGTLGKMLSSKKVPLLDLSYLKAKEIKEEAVAKILEDFTRENFHPH